MVQNPPAADHHDAAGCTGSSGSTGPTSWMGHKQRGRECYEGGDYSQALASYRAALHPEYGCPDQERQILLSNVVACRLQLGGPAQAEAAVSDAKHCVRIDPNWSKGHVRLASAYVATENPANSNDACNALQTALRLDPGNTFARQMLVRELKRERRRRRGGGASSRTTSRDEPPPPAQNPNYVPPSSSSFPPRSDGAASGAGSSSASTSNSSWSTTTGPEPYEATAPPPTAPQHGDRQPQQQQPDPTEIDDQLSWFDRARFYTSRVNVWYGNLSADTRNALVVAAVVLILYASFAMDASSSGYYSSSGSSGGYRGNRRRRAGNYGWSLSHVFDGGGLQVMLLALAYAYGCHLRGINPMRALLLQQIMGGGGGRRRGFYGGYRGPGFNIVGERQRHHHHSAR